MEIITLEMNLLPQYRLKLPERKEHMKAEYKAAAKINLMLDILRTLDNGYHSLIMILQSVGLCDSVSVETTDVRKIA